MIYFAAEIKIEMNLQRIPFEVFCLFVFLEGLVTLVSSSFFLTPNFKQFSYALNSNWSKFRE